MAKILWQREVDARHDLAVAVMHLSDAPDAMYDHLIPTGPDMKAPRWRTTMCGSESEAIDLLRQARDSLLFCLNNDPGRYSVLNRQNGPRWDFSHTRNLNHTILSLACTGPQAADFVRNEPSLLGACVNGCASAYDWQGFWSPGIRCVRAQRRTIASAYLTCSGRILKRWLSALPGPLDPDHVEHWELAGYIGRLWIILIKYGLSCINYEFRNIFSSSSQPTVMVSSLGRDYCAESRVFESRYARNCKKQNGFHILETSGYELYRSIQTMIRWCESVTDTPEICMDSDKNRQLWITHVPGPGPCGVEWLDKIVADLPAPLK